jgi:hypothetical protein
MFVIEAAILGSAAIVLSSLNLAKYLVKLDAAEMKESNKPTISEEARRASFAERRRILERRRDLWLENAASKVLSEKTRSANLQNFKDAEEALLQLAIEEAKA